MGSNPKNYPEGYFGWILLDGERGKSILSDSLHNLSIRENGEEHEFSRGVLVGIVSALMACGMDFDSACKLCWQAAPTDIAPERVPETWRDKFAGKIAHSATTQGDK